MGREEQVWAVAVGLSISSMVPSTVPTLPCDGTACETPMYVKKMIMAIHRMTIGPQDFLLSTNNKSFCTKSLTFNAKLRMGLQVFLNFGFHPFGPVSCYLVSSPSRYLQVDQVSIHLCLHTFRRLSFLHFSVWDVSQALTQPFACFPLSLHCFSGLTSGLGAVFVQPSCRCCMQR